MKSNSYARVGHLVLRKFNGIFKDQLGDATKALRESGDYEVVCRILGKLITSIVFKEAAKDCEVVEALEKIDEAS